MDTAKLNDWLTVITNIGVIAGLVLLAYEIGQTNESLEQDAAALRVSNLFSQNDMWQRLEDSISQNPEFAALWMRGGASETLSVVDQERYERFTSTMFWAAINTRGAAQALNPERPGLSGATALYNSMRGKPGLKARFDEWSKDWPAVGAILASDLDEIERRRQSP